MNPLGTSSEALHSFHFLGALLDSDVLNPGRHHALHPAASQGGNIEWLYWVIFWICFAAFVLTLGMFTRASARSYVTSSPEPPPLVEDEEGDRRASWVVGSAVGLTVVTLLIVLFLSVVTGKKVQGVESNNSVTIQVKAHQWWWEFVYPNSQAGQTITTANEIHVPVGQRVVIVTSSSDVIHSFWAPNITGKRDAIPGYSSALSFQIDAPGIYQGQCAEFCGLQHAHMGFSITAEPPEQFEAWRQQQLTSGKEPDNDVTKLGHDVFMSHACVMCHTISGTEAGSRVGPDLTHIGSRRKIAAETLPNTTGALAGWILDPQRQKPGTQMPPNALRGDELQALIAYLQSLQ